MNKRLWIIPLIVLSALAVTVALVRAVYADPVWTGGDPASQLDTSGYNRYNAMAQADDGTIAIVWSRVAPDQKTGPRWLTLTQRTGNTWGAPITLRTVTTDINQPAVAYLGNIWHVAWTEGLYGGPAKLMVLRNGGTVQVLQDPVYRYTTPDIASAANGLHMVYAAATSPNYPNNKPDLYYTFYPANGSAWTAPTIAITSSQVLTPGVKGEIWYPRIAVTPDGTSIHLVWEQVVDLAEGARYEVWYVKGTLSGSNVTWGQARRLSPQGQYALRPEIVLNAQGYPHVIWTEALPPLGRPTAQYIDYRFQNAQGWSIPIRIDPYNAAVSNLNPTYVQAEIALHENRLCVAWHASRDPNAKEELLLTCSENQGSTWGTTVNVSNTPEKLSLYPHLLFNRQGKLLLTWIESNSTKWLWDYNPFFRSEKTNLYKLYLPITLRNKTS